MSRGDRVIPPSTGPLRDPPAPRFPQAEATQTAAADIASSLSAIAQAIDRLTEAIADHHNGNPT